MTGGDRAAARARASYRKPSPSVQLQIALNAAARNIADANYRIIAAKDADRIAQTHHEKLHNWKRSVVLSARALLRRLPQIAPDEHAEIASALRGFATMLSTRAGAPVEIQELGKRTIVVR